MRYEDDSPKEDVDRSLRDVAPHEDLSPDAGRNLPTDAIGEKYEAANMEEGQASDGTYPSRYAEILDHARQMVDRDQPGLEGDARDRAVHDKMMDLIKNEGVTLHDSALGAPVGSDEMNQASEKHKYEKYPGETDEAQARIDEMADRAAAPDARGSAALLAAELTTPIPTEPLEIKDAEALQERAAYEEQRRAELTEEIREANQGADEKKADLASRLPEEADLSDEQTAWEAVQSIENSGRRAEAERAYYEWAEADTHLTDLEWEKKELST